MGQLLGKKKGEMVLAPEEDDYVNSMFQCDRRYEAKQENEDRGNWPHALQGFVVMLGPIMGSFASFIFLPYALLQYGPIFLLPYSIFLLLLAVPLYYLESTIGQFSGSGLLTCWMVPIFKGVGMCILAVNIPYTIIQAMYTSHGLYYLHLSVMASLHCDKLPWQSMDTLNASAPECLPEENNSTDGVVGKLFYQCHVQSQWGDDASMTDVNTPLAICLLIVWIIVGFISSFGIRAIAWISTVLIPVSFIILAVISGVADNLSHDNHIWQYTDKGLGDGGWMIGFAIIAAFLMVLSTSGIILTYSSYNRFHNDVFRDGALIFIMKYVVDLLVATFLGGILYHMDSKTGDLASKFTESFDLKWPFLALADGLTSVNKSSNGLAIAFYMMFFFLSLLAVLAALETFVTAVLDQFPRARRFRPLFVLLFSLIFFFLGIALCTKSGFFWNWLVESKLSGWIQVLIMLLMLGCFLLYGIQTYFRYRHDVAAMSRYHLWCFPASIMWWGCAAILVILIPLIMLAGGSSYLHARGSGVSGTIREYTPDWADNHMYHLGRCVEAFPIVVLFITALIQILVSIFRKSPDIRTLFGATPSWMPTMPKHWQRVNLYRDLNPHSTSNYTDRVGPSAGQELDKHPFVVRA